MHLRLLVIAALGLAWAAPVSAPAQDAAQGASFDPRTYRSHLVGEPTQVLVLGTPHLSGAPADFDRSVLEPLLWRLEAFNPDVITIEGLSGESLWGLRAYAGVYADTAEDYGRRVFAMAALGRAGTGYDMPQAEAEARTALAALGDDPTPAQRRRMAALFAASGDPNSALVQWRRLSVQDRIAEDGIVSALADALNGFETRRNENHLIGAELAVRLGLERVHPSDDHAADDILLPHVTALTALYEQPAYRDMVTDPALQHLATASQRLTTADQVLETYRDLNSAARGQQDADLQWRILLQHASPDDIARRRLAEWETRNLRMVAHIREAAAEAPGGRVLVIVGSAHKPWFDAYLGMMTDIQVVDAATILQ
jgi:hypothetical protein